MLEEVEYVTLDLGVVEPTLVPSSGAFRLIGLDTPRPYLQLAGTLFAGAHHTLLGTELLFADAPDRRGLVPAAHTERRIVFREAELRAREPAAAAQTSNQTSNQHTRNATDTNDPAAQKEENRGPKGQKEPAKRRRPRTVAQVVGGEDAESEPPVRRRGSRKGKARADAAEE